MFTLAVAFLMLVASSAPESSAAQGFLTTAAEAPGAPRAHRIAVAVHPTELVVWDQLVYDGAPEDFAYLMPVPDGTTIELGDNAFFEALTLAARVTLETSTLVCTSDGAAASRPTAYEMGPIASATTPGPDDGGVVVSDERVVGPFETATLVGDADVIINWLLDKGYVVPEALRPLLTTYAAEGNVFVVVRLAPGLGVDRMQPVRFRLPLDAHYPLRMLAPSAGAAIDLELFVIADARSEVIGFENAEVDHERLAYDGLTRRFNYSELFELALRPSVTVRARWVTEHAAVLGEEVRAYRSIPAGSPSGSIERMAMADVDLATDGLSLPILTRLRTRLEPEELDTDVGVGASTGGFIAGRLSVDRVINRPECPDAGVPLDVGVSPPPRRGRGCDCTLPRGGCLFDCSVAHGPGAPSSVLLILGVLALRARRRLRTRGQVHHPSTGREPSTAGRARGSSR